MCRLYRILLIALLLLLVGLTVNFIKSHSELGAEIKVDPGTSVGLAWKEQDGLNVIDRIDDEDKDGVVSIRIPLNAVKFATIRIVEGQRIYTVVNLASNTLSTVSPFTIPIFRNANDRLEVVSHIELLNVNPSDIMTKSTTYMVIDGSIKEDNQIRIKRAIPSDYQDYEDSVMFLYENKFNVLSDFTGNVVVISMERYSQVFFAEWSAWFRTFSVPSLLVISFALGLRRNCRNVATN